MSYAKGLVATLAELEDFYKGQAAGDIIELMNQTNDIISDIPWMESNQSDGHLTRIRTGLPEVYWRRLYKGIPPSKGKWSQVKEGCGILEALMELDVAEVELYGDKAKAFRLSEAKAFVESMRQKVAKTLFYGDNTKNPDEFNGFAMRYPSLKSPNVIDACGKSGGGAKLASMYLIDWGSDTVHGLYPKGSSGGLTHEDLGRYMTVDEDGRKFQCVGDKHNWKCGLTVRDWRAVVRICNIDTTKLFEEPGTEGYVDLQKLTIEAKNKMPESMRGKAIWYAPSEVMTGLEVQSINRSNVHLTYGEFFGSKGVPMLHGRPVRQCDALSVDEAEVK